MAAQHSSPSDPAERQEHHLPVKSYAEAVVDNAPVNGHIISSIEEDDETADLPVPVEAIKETPPRGNHARHSSEPRPLGEVMDEARADSSSPSLPSSPALRHVKGRLEEKDSRESYAEAVKNHSPGRDSDGPVNGTETYDGVGHDEEPRSPVRRVHKRTSSRSLEANGTKVEENGKPVRKGIHFPKIGQFVEDDMQPKLIYENTTNKSGENLASLQPGNGYYASLQQRADKPSSNPSTELVSGRRAGAGWSRSAIRWAPMNVPLQRRLQTLLVLLHTLSIAGGLAIFFFLCAVPILWPILLPYLLYVLFSTAHSDGKLSHRSDRLRHSKIWSLFASYFPARLHRSQVLEPTRKYIFGYHPHGIISHGAFAAFATEALGFSQLFPGITNTLLTLDSNFRIPLYRDYALRMGLASVSRESCEALLTRGGPNGEGMGRAITIVVGGARESLDAKPATLRLVLRRRKGFVKLAVRTGADLVPVLAFGENDIYDQLDTLQHPYIHKLQMVVKKFMGFTVPLFHARGVFNYDVGLMPYRRPINVVVGRPIEIRQANNPDPAYVDEVHERYVQELERLWEEWKDTFARHRKGELEIIE